MGRVEGEERRARTRERLHSETAISRDEAFSKQTTKKKTINTAFVYQVESSLWHCSIYFLPHCFFSSSPKSEGHIGNPI